MSIRFTCQHCDAKIKVPNGSEGRKMKCPRCGLTQRVPDRSTRGDSQAGGDTVSVDGGSQATASSEELAVNVSHNDEDRSIEPVAVGSSAKVADKSRGSTSGPPKVVFGDRLNIPLVRQPKPGTEPVSDRARQSSTESKPERAPAHKPEPGPPSYHGLTVMSWVLRVMAVGSFVGSYKLMLAAKRHGFSFWEAVMVLVVGVAISAAIWAGGDALEALRDIARNRHRD